MNSIHVVTPFSMAFQSVAKASQLCLKETCVLL